VFIDEDAAKTLGEIGDDTAASARVEVMTNRTEDARWVAAEALIRRVHAALISVLKELLKGASQRCRGSDDQKRQRSIC
jgi:HEAT repeat protein